ncbi:MAG TPA: MFS transporter [Candidatus Paceibacterota bacterium]|nr:MFS transporter [Candidatus Paceibacterota bacterium]
MPEEKRLAGKRYAMYIIGFVFNLSSAIPTYVNSTFLAKFAGDKLVGIVYTASSILAIAAFIEMSGMLRRFGNFKTTVCLLFLELVSLAGLATGQSALVIISSFILNFVSIALINFALDIFLEEFSSDRQTGRIRGAFLTVVNSAWLVSPLLASWILGDNIYGNMYAVSGILLVPVVLMVFFSLREVKDPVFEKLSFWKSFAAAWVERDIKSILFIQFLLQFFYAWMIIYTPLYLHTVAGFDWPTIGVIFTAMLAPFVLLEGPLGWVADKVGEKTILSVGFVIMGASTGLIGYVTDHNIYIWAAILFMTRVGAAMVEVMADTYFFKKVDATNSNVISFSRMARPTAYVVGPVVATLLFTVFDMKGLFIFLGLFMLYGLRYSLTMREAR